MIGSTIKVVATAENGNTFESDETEAVGVYDYVTLVSAEQSGTKTIRVEFSDAVTVDDELTVFKGTAEVAIEDIDYDGDFEGATLTMKDKITEAEYTVVLTPEDGEPTEATFDGEVSELGTIEFLNNYLILADNTYQKGYAYVKGYDQFGTEINLAGLTVTCGVGDMTAYDSKTGKITLESDTDNAYMFIKQVPVFVSYQTGEGIISAQANLEVSTRSFVDEIEFGEIKKDGTARDDGRLTITELASKKYYVELTTVKDQYGNDLSYKDLNKMVADNVMFVIPGANNGAYYTTNGFDEIDGTTVLWLAPVADPKPGSMDLSITGAGGYTASTPVEVEDDPYIQTISITYPQLYAGHSKSADLAFTAIDQYGKEVDMWDVRPTLGDAQTLQFTDKNHMTGKPTEVKLSGAITFNDVIEDTVAKTWTVNINATAAQAKNMAVVTTLTAGMVPYTKTITIGAQGNAINVLGKLSDNSKLELNPKANTKINFNQYLQFEDVNGEVMDRISSEMYPIFSNDATIVLNETDSNIKMSDYTNFYWYLSESELPATSAYTLAGIAQAAGAANRTTNPILNATGVVTNNNLAVARTSSKKYYVTVVGLANGKYYKLSEQDFRVTYIPAEDVKDAVLGNVVRKDTNAAGVNNFDPSATTNKYSAKISGPIYVNSDNGTEKAVELTVTNETGETYTLPLGDGYRVSTDSGLKINADGYTVSGKVSGVTSGTATLDVWLTDNDKKIDTITVNYTNADPVPTSVKYEGIQTAPGSKSNSKVGSTFTFAPATRVETSKTTPTKVGTAANVTAKDGKIEITNANNVLDTYTAQVKDQYGVDWTKAEYYVNGEKVEWNGQALLAGKEYVFKMIAGTVTKEITVVPGVNSTATVNQVVPSASTTVYNETQLKNAFTAGSDDTVTLGKDITLTANFGATEIETGDKLIVPAEYTLDINSKTLTVDGKLEVSGEVADTGASGTVTGNGTVTVKKGAIYNVTSSLTLADDSLHVESGATVVVKNLGGFVYASENIVADTIAAGAVITIGEGLDISDANGAIPTIAPTATIKVDASTDNPTITLGGDVFGADEEAGSSGKTEFVVDLTTDEDNAATKEAAEFKKTYADILAKTADATETGITLEDEDELGAAETAYEALDSDVQDLLTTEATKLEDLREYVDGLAILADANTIKTALEGVTATGATFEIPATYRALVSNVGKGSEASAPVIDDDASRWTYSAGEFTVTSGADMQDATATWTVSKGGYEATVTLTLTGALNAATYTRLVAVSGVSAESEP